MKFQACMNNECNKLYSGTSIWVVQEEEEFTEEHGKVP
jgi:hypothetical protein